MNGMGAIVRKMGIPGYGGDGKTADVRATLPLAEVPLALSILEYISMTWIDFIIDKNFNF